VTGATGKRGGARAQLFADGSLVRNANIANALALRQAVAELVIGDLRHRELLHGAIRGLRGLKRSTVVIRNAVKEKTWRKHRAADVPGVCST
jgi:hypothetical protein